MKSLLDPTFRYIPSAETDLAATFRRVIRERKAQEEAERQAAEERLHKVVSSIRQSKGAT